MDLFLALLSELHIIEVFVPCGLSACMCSIFGSVAAAALLCVGWHQFIWLDKAQPKLLATELWSFYVRVAVGQYRCLPPRCSVEGVSQIPLTNVELQQSGLLFAVVSERWIEKWRHQNAVCWVCCVFSFQPSVGLRRLCWHFLIQQWLVFASENVVVPRRIFLLWSRGSAAWWNCLTVAALSHLPRV